MPLPLPKPPEAAVEAVEVAAVEEQAPEAKPVDRPVEVVALRAGFYQRERKVEGDKFMVASMQKLGDWMKCVDPKLEKLHQAAIKEKKAKLRAEQLAAK